MYGNYVKTQGRVCQVKFKTNVDVKIRDLLRYMILDFLIFCTKRKIKKVELSDVEKCWCTRCIGNISRSL